MAPSHLATRSPIFNPGEDVVSNIILIAIFVIALLFTGIGIYMIARKRASMRKVALNHDTSSIELSLKDVERGMSRYRATFTDFR
jgi:hypothetical protein